MARGSITNISQKREHEDINLGYGYGFGPGTASYQMTTRVVNTVEMECDFDELARIVTRFVEFEQMQYEPECRELINQAKFINRLKNGVNYDPL